MSKYDPLGKYLREQKSSLVPMSFTEIERVTGVNLPPKAQSQRAWWSNNPSNNVMTKVWLDAGFKSEQVDLVGRKLVFRRFEDESAMGQGLELEEPRRAFKPEEKKPRRHPMFGALKGMITIEPGYDLTEPAMPEWADLIDEKYGLEKSK